jgi:hypothetical protein
VYKPADSGAGGEGEIRDVVLNFGKPLQNIST